MLYGVETKRINETVRNNPLKFPKDSLGYYQLMNGIFGSRKFRPQVFQAIITVVEDIIRVLLQNKEWQCWQQF